MADTDRGRRTRSTTARADGELGDDMPVTADPHPGEPDSPEFDWGEPATGAVHGANHTRRPHKTEVQLGHGPQTNRRNKEIVSGRLYRR
jgi:hypothetical protein